MTDYGNWLEEWLHRKEPWETYRYRPYYGTSVHEKSLSEEFVEKLAEEGDEEKVFEKFMRKGLRRPGTEKKRVEAYLRRALEDAQEEGRI